MRSPMRHSPWPLIHRPLMHSVTHVRNVLFRSRPSWLSACLAGGHASTPCSRRRRSDTHSICRCMGRRSWGSCGLRPLRWGDGREGGGESKTAIGDAARAHGRSRRMQPRGMQSHADNAVRGGWACDMRCAAVSQALRRAYRMTLRSGIVDPLKSDDSSRRATPRCSAAASKAAESAIAGTIVLAASRL